MAVDPDDLDNWFASAALGPREAHDPVRNAKAVSYRWHGSCPWKALSGGGLPQPLESFPTALTAAPGWLFAGLRDGRICASRDGGERWQQLAIDGDALSHVETLAVAA